MFDDNKPNLTTPPNNLPVSEPEDMFAGIDNAASNIAQPKRALDAGLLKRKDPMSAGSEMGMNMEQPQTTQGAMPPSMTYKVKDPVLGKILFGLIVVLAAVGAGMGGWWLYAKYFADQSVAPITPAVQTPVEIPQTEELTPPIENVLPPENVLPAETADTSTEAVSPVEGANDQLLFGEPVDADKDGLDDAKEMELSTDINNPDSDNDGLSDGDEVIIWKTDPLNPDSDGDSYKDGTEVRNGYNPLGPGKLFDVKSLTTSTTK